MELIEVMKQRYSCKNYSDQKISDDILTEILEAGRLAPTAKNGQIQKVYVLNSKESLGFVDEVSPCRYNAQTVLAISYDKNNVYVYPDGVSNSGMEDTAIVTTHMMLRAKELGVDSCWLNFFDPNKLHELLGLPENEQIAMLLDLGYPKEGAGPLPNHSLRKELSQTVVYK